MSIQITRTLLVFITVFFFQGCISENSDYLNMEMASDKTLVKREDPDGENTNMRCSDGRDNDKNGVEDCDDPNCSTVAVCMPESICDDGLDNNSDGDIDCDDSACSDFLPCVTDREDNNAACADNKDNDEDGKFDCDDPSCASVAVCLPEGQCDDGKDNDGDGDKDCEDSDCDGFSICIDPPEPPEITTADVTLKILGKTLGNDAMPISKEDVSFYDLTDANDIGGQRIETTDEGLLNLTNIERGDRQIEIRAKGYTPFVGELKVDSDMDVVEFVLLSDDYNKADTIISDSMFVVYKEEGIPLDSAQFAGSPGYEGDWGVFSDDKHPMKVKLETVTGAEASEGTEAFKITATPSWGGLFYQFGEEVTQPDLVDMSYWHDAKLMFDIKSNFNVQLKMEWGMPNASGTGAAVMWLNDYGMKPDDKWYSIEIPFGDLMTKKSIEEMRIVVNFVKIADGEYIDEGNNRKEVWTPAVTPVFYVDNVRYAEKRTKLCLTDAEGMLFCEEAED
ncbi:MAG: hypothetical protein OCD01_11525 [Fibrobacterales bacterium]